MTTRAKDASRSEGLRVLGLDPYCRLVTFRRNGTPVGVPVWQAVDGDRIYVFTESKSWKVKRLARDERIEVTTCDWRGTTDGNPTWKGKGRVVSDPDTVRRANAALDRKYGWQKWGVDLMSRLSGRYHQRAMLEIVLED